MVRQAIFSILGNIKGTRVLDIFAGSGSLGIEALSRGAIWADFVDINQEACTAIKQNVNYTRFRGKTEVHQISAEEYLTSCLPNQYNIVLADPPYEFNIDHILVKLLRVLKDDSVVVYLHHRDALPPSKISGLDYKETRKYGLTGVTFLTKVEN